MKIRWFGLGLFLLLSLAACSSKGGTNQPSTATVPSGISGVANVSSIEILPNPPDSQQQRILIHGDLPEKCAVLGNPSVQQSGSNFDITIPFSRTSDPNCGQESSGFDTVVNINTSTLAPGSYTIHASSISTGFNIPAEVSSITATPVPSDNSQDLTTVSTPSDSNSGQPETTPTEAASPAVPNEITPQAGSPTSCTNKLAFFADITIPDGTLFKQGEAFTKTWRLRNEGTCAITSAYTLVFATGDPLNGPLTSPMPNIQPGEIADLSLNLSAPNQGGTYGANYEFRDPDGRRFGVNSNGVDYIWVEIKVDWSNSSSQLASTTTAATPATLPVIGNCSYTENPGYIDQILALVNAARANEGVHALSPNPLLMAAAKIHSLDMGCNNFLDHTGSDGSKAKDRMIAQGYKPTYSAENIYAGATEYGADAQGAFDWWMNSPVHRKNILNARPTEVGIGYVNVPGSNFGGYYTMVFGKP